MSKVVIDKATAVAIHEELVHHRDKAVRKARRFDRLLGQLVAAKDVEIVSDDAAPPPPAPEPPPSTQS